MTRAVPCSSFGLELISAYFAVLATAKWNTFWLFAGINVALCLFTLFCLPETKGVKLEEMDVLFGGKNHVDAGAEIMGAKSFSSEEKGQHGEQLESATEQPQLRKTTV